MKRYVSFDAGRIVYFCTVDDATAAAIKSSGLFLESVPEGIAEDALTLEDLESAYPEKFTLSLDLSPQ